MERLLVNETVMWQYLFCPTEQIKQLKKQTNIPRYQLQVTWEICDAKQIHIAAYRTSCFVKKKKKKLKNLKIVSEEHILKGSGGMMSEESCHV